MAKARRQSKYAQKTTHQEYFFKPPINIEQQRLVRLIYDNDIVIARGAAGVGKTFTALQEGLRLLSMHKIDQILYVRNVNDFQQWGSRGIGYLKGTEAEKKANLLLPIRDNLEDIVHKTKLDYLLKEKIEPVILDDLLGRSFKNKFVIADEAQNMPAIAIKLILTRLSENSTIVLIGDYRQKATRHLIDDGLTDAVRRLQGMDRVGIMQFSDTCSASRHPILPGLIARYSDV